MSLASLNPLTFPLRQERLIPPTTVERMLLAPNCLPMETLWFMLRSWAGRALIRALASQ